MNQKYSTVLEDAPDIYTPAEAGSLKRTFCSTDSGIFRLARRSCAVYAIEIKAGGSWGRLMLLDGRGTIIFHQPSTFTGSFPLNEGCAFDGLYLWNDCGEGTTDAQVVVSWREKDAQLI